MERTERVSYLTSALGTQVRNRFTDLLAPLGIHPKHYGLLHTIASRAGSSQQEVADLMQIRRSLMVALVDDVEEAGLLTRGRHPVDRRAHALHLTAAGRRLLTKADRVADQLDAELLAPLDDRQGEAFHTALRAVGGAAGLVPGVFPEHWEPSQRSHAAQATPHHVHPTERRTT